METKQKSFTTAYRNIEIDIVRNEIKLLRKYVQISDVTAREQFIPRFHPILRAIVKKNVLSPDELIARLTRAIKLDKYRPRNMSLFMLAISPDLYNIRGKFDTFDVELSQMFRAPTRDDFAIRDRFDGTTLNRIDLSKQMTHDWLRRASKFPAQMAAARNATGNSAVAAYTELFNLLLSEFCREYKWDRSKVDVIISIVDDFPADGSHDDANGFFTEQFLLFLPKSMPESEQQRIFDEFAKNPKTHPLSHKRFTLNLSLSRLMRGAQIENKPFFDYVFAAFAHEMQHILDKQIPRMGAMGPQVTKIDSETYVKEDYTEYRKSASELSAYAVTNEMLAQLSKQNS